MVKLINFFRQGGIYSIWFLYGLPRPLVGWIRACVALPARPVRSQLFRLRHIVIAIFSSMVATKCPALFRIRSISLTFTSPDCCCPELTPRFSRCGVMSSLQANIGTMCDSVPSKLQSESGELHEQVNVTAPKTKEGWSNSRKFILFY